MLNEESMDNEGLLTVLLFTYNHKQFFSKAIESVFAQKTNFDFKIHIVDDASSDGTSDLIREYAQKYPDKIIPFIREDNIGLAENMYHGIKDIKTKYYATMETDDFWCDENKLQMQVDILEKNPDCSFSGHNTAYNYFDNPEHPNQGQSFYNIETQKISFPKKFDKNKFIKIHISSRVCRTSCLELDKVKNHEIISWDSTNYWWFLSKGKCYYIDKVMSVYNVNGFSTFIGSGVNNQIKMAIKNVLAINKEFDYKYNKIFLDVLKLHHRVPKIKYWELKYFTRKSKLEDKYVDIVSDLFPIKIYAGISNNNLGDVLNYYLLYKISRYYLKTTARKSNFIAIGSILDACFFRKRNKRFHKEKIIHVWGSGFITDAENLSTLHKDLGEEFVSTMEIHALRGKLSKERCEKILDKNLDNIALGDPGLLINRFIDYSKIEKKYDVGIIPHYTDKGSEFLNNIKLEKYTSQIIDVSGDTIETLYQIAQCRVVLSSAMHGLIVSDSFNIPNQWIELSNNVIGNGYKFRDYYSVFNIENPQPIDLRSQTVTDEDIDKIRQAYSITKEQVEDICIDLLSAFPEELKN